MKQTETSQTLMAAEMAAFGYPDKEIMEKLNVSRTTLWRWRQSDEYKEEYATIKAALRQHMKHRLDKLKHLALDALESTLCCKENDKVRAETAFKILAMLKHGKFTEVPPAPPPTATLVKS